jgi:hypothetical protein
VRCRKALEFEPSIFREFLNTRALVFSLERGALYLHSIQGNWRVLSAWADTGLEHQLYRKVSGSTPVLSSVTVAKR